MYKPPPINELGMQFSRSARLACFVLAIVSFALVMNITDPFAWGFIVGGLVSVLNGYLLKLRLQGIMNPEFSGFKGAIMQNFTMRYALIVLVLLFASRVEFLSIFGVGAGLLLMSALVVIDAIITLYRHFGTRDAVDKI